MNVGFGGTKEKSRERPNKVGITVGVQRENVSGEKGKADENGRITQCQPLSQYTTNSVSSCLLLYLIRNFATFFILFWVFFFLGVAAKGGNVFIS